jgi:chemotaxis response regulator CheB
MLPQHIIVIGGSAGSLEALTPFFDRTPLNNASYIILRHLPSGYKTELKSILKNHSILKIEEAKNDGTIENNKVYYPSSTDYLMINDGTFKFEKRVPEAFNRTIDTFLMSLAKNENKRRTIVIILSGVGTDGVVGTAEIRKAGGLVIVQSPASCQFADLPQKIIEGGNADFILDPADMPVVIHGYITKYANTLN